MSADVVIFLNACLTNSIVSPFLCIHFVQCRLFTIFKGATMITHELNLLKFHLKTYCVLRFCTYNNVYMTLNNAMQYISIDSI